MCTKYKFQKANIEDVNDIIKVISDRIDWMNKNDIHQWNETKYFERYPKEYFIRLVNEEIAYILKDENKLIAFAALYKTDIRWKDVPNDKSIYVHHLSSLVDYKGSGVILLKEIINFAKENGYNYVRLDSDINNRKLEKIYTDLGFVPNGLCDDGLYHGIRRELDLRRKDY